MTTEELIAEVNARGFEVAVKEGRPVLRPRPGTRHSELGATDDLIEVLGYHKVRLMRRLHPDWRPPPEPPEIVDEPAPPDEPEFPETDPADEVISATADAPRPTAGLAEAVPTPDVQAPRPSGLREWIWMTPGRIVGKRHFETEGERGRPHPEGAAYWRHVGEELWHYIGEAKATR
jgi:hypothetical protein